MSAHYHDPATASATQHPTPGQQPTAYAAPYGHGMPAAMGFPPHPSLANLGARLGARVLDSVFWYIGYFVTAIPVMIWIDGDGGSAALTLLLTWLAISYVLYFPFSTWKYGSTLGKRICRIRVVRTESAQHVGFWRAVGREAFYIFAGIIPVLGLLNPLWCCWDKPFQQCLHDKVADTMVVTR